VGSSDAGDAAPFQPSVPTLGACWQIAGVPDLGTAFNSPGQQPVDFAIWPAADGTWQLWSCIRGTMEEGNTRLFHRWEGAQITDANWTPKGIAMRAGRVTPSGTPNDGAFDPSFGEAMGGLQAPYVWNDGTSWHMVYGTWGDLAEQVSADGKTFARVPRSSTNDVRIFAPGSDGKRDPMLLPIGGVQHLYFTANSSVYLSTSTDGASFSQPQEVAFGGQAGTGGSAAECPFVVQRTDGLYYLFRTSSENAPAGNYQAGVMTYVYASPDPTYFGINDDSRLVAQLPIAATEIHTVHGVDYIAHLLASVQGIEICQLNWH
jgi:hypothetical protein